VSSILEHRPFVAAKIGPILAAVFLVFAGGYRIASAEALAKINLARSARLFATHTEPADEFDIRHATDGDTQTKWVGQSHPLSWQPTNIVIEFKKPTAVQRLVLVSQIFRERLALKDFEVYAWADKAWAGATPLAVMKGTRDLRTVVDFIPVKTTRLRIRIRDTWRDDHCYPRLAEIEVYAAPRQAKLMAPKDSPLADEKKSERLLLAQTLGAQSAFPTEKFDPAKGYLHYAKTFLDTMIAEGRDRYGAVHSPMFASLLELDTHENPEDTPANVPGQRYGDRSIHGGNLFHDIMLLRACDYATSLTGDHKYRNAASDYLRFFLDNCPQPTGLFPWGEHAYWNFYKEAPGSTTHEYLGGIPMAFWERMWALNPRAVRGEADGLINHVVNLDTYDFDRHADIVKPLPTPRPKGIGFLDFPRHGGFYISVWTFVYSKTGDARYLDWSLKTIDHHWRLRNPRSGLPRTSLQAESKNTASAESVLSLSVSLLESALLLPAGEARNRYESVARAYLDSILRLPHRPREGRLVAAFPLDSEPARAKGDYSHPYRYMYGGAFTADDAVLLLAVYRLTGDKRALRLAEDCAAYYARRDPPPPPEIVRAHVYAGIIGLFCDLYDLEHKPAHLKQAERYARLAIERLFYRGLFRGATGINHYESDMMVGNLVYSLVWLHALKENAKVKVEPNRFNR